MSKTRSAEITVTRSLMSPETLPRKAAVDQLELLF